MNIFRYLNKWDYVAILIIIGLVVVQVWLDLLLPEYLNVIIEDVSTVGDLNNILFNGGYMLACALGSGLIAILTGFFAARVAAGFAMRLRSGVFDKVQGFSMEEINKFSTPKSDYPFNQRYYTNSNGSSNGFARNYTCSNYGNLGYYKNS